MINKFGALPFKGPIHLTNPKRVFLILEDWENNHVTSNLIHTFNRAYFGIQVCKIGRGIKKNLVKSYTKKVKILLTQATSYQKDLI